MCCASCILKYNFNALKFLCKNVYGVFLSVMGLFAVVIVLGSHVPEGV